jgi:sugar lactone lactonase YvrE
MNVKAELIGDIRAAHGEGPVWDANRHRLFWVDLTGQRLLALDPENGSVELVDFPEPVCAVAPWNDGRLLVAFAKRLAWIDWPGGGRVEEIVAVEPAMPGNRCNDGKRDPAGRFWIGTMSHDGSVAGAGALYRLENDGTLARILDGLTIANGMGWSPDTRTMYFIDSPTREVWAFDFDSHDSAISRRRTIIRVPEDLGLPDGMTVDEGGRLWVAHWGAGCVCQWDPVTGDCLATVSTGCPHTSSCAFGGRELKDLYITTSRLALDEAALAAAPQSGGLFRHSLLCGHPTSGRLR